MPNIAVYGTLRKGMPNFNRCIGGPCKFLGVVPQLVGTGTLAGCKLLVSGGWLPIAVRDGSSSVVVEVWNIPDSVLAPITLMEIGCGYTAEKAQIKLDSGEVAEALVYLGNDFPDTRGLLVIHDGDYSKWFVKNRGAQLF